MKYSIVIPFKGDSFFLYRILAAISRQTVLPENVIVVMVSQFDKRQLELVSAILAREPFRSFQVELIESYGSFPGLARNLGVERVATELVGFLDIHTIPDDCWASSCLKLFDNQVDVVLCKTRFVAYEGFKLDFRDLIFGRDGIYTLPGSFVKQKVFERVGLFNSDVRAGEDTAWINQVVQSEINVVKVQEPLIRYDGIMFSSVFYLYKKWWRNYISSGSLPQFAIFRRVIFLAFYILLLYIVLNWNGVFAAWDEGSVFYIAHISKLFIVISFLAYLIWRVILRPLNRGVPVLSNGVVGLARRILVAMALDGAKSISMLLAARRP